MGPGSFRDQANWTEIYQLVPLGFTEATIVMAQTVDEFVEQIEFPQG